MLKRLSILAVLVTLSAPAAVAQEAFEVDPERYAVEFENDDVRVVRITYGPGEKSVMHEHMAGVAVFLTTQNTRMHMPDGTYEDFPGEAGGAVWHPAVTHQPENLSDEPLEVILIEIKGKHDMKGEHDEMKEKHEPAEASE